MRIRVTAPSSKVLGQATLVAFIAAMAAGCSGSDRFATPLFTGSTDNQRQIIGNGQPMPPPVANGAVARTDLPPPGTTVAAAAVPQNGANLAPGAYQWTPGGVKPSGSATTASATGQSGVHVVSPGETVYSIGRQYGVSPNAIIAANGLALPGDIRSGQRLTIPGASASTLASNSTAQPAAPQMGSSSVSASVLGASPADSKSQVAKSEPRVIPGVPSIPVEKKSSTPSPIPASTTAAVDEEIEPPSADGTSFRWPVRGRIISGFGAKPSGQRNDGINLAVPEGTTVKAAEAGTVIYAGNELEGYGNLVLIRHADDWVSAYAHNSEVKVKKGDQIRRGQTVATAGMSGSVTSPQVHFELRKKAKPVNPLDYLAGV
jgi:murein DD-endopeptidase MepM/ murein hydrolase activator NlpD